MPTSKRADDGPGYGGDREEHARAIVHALEPRIGNGAGERVEEDHGEGDARDSVGALVGIEEEEQGHEDEATPRADDGAVRPDYQSSGNEPEPFEHESDDPPARFCHEIAGSSGDLLS